MTPAVGRCKTNGRNDTEGHRRTIAVRKENICGTIGICRVRLSARNGELKEASELTGGRANGVDSGNSASRQQARLYRLTAEVLRLTQGC